MAKYVIDESTLEGLANAIRTVTGDNKTYTPNEMVQAVTNIMESATYILVDGSGREIPAVYVDSEVVFTATPNDVREGEIAVSDTGVIEGTLSLDEVYEDGRKAEYDQFWDIFQENGNRSSYPNAFSYGWTKDNFKPKYDIRPTGYYGDNCMFQYCGELDLQAALTHCGVNLDMSQVTRCNCTFDRSSVSGIPPIDLRSCTTMYRTFYNASKITALTINNIQDSCTFDNAFFWTTGLTELNITGTIGQDGFAVSNSPLTHDSLMSIINALKDFGPTATKTVTLGAINLAKLTDEEKAIATQKGWTLA